MRTIYFATTNQLKADIAAGVLKEYGVKLLQTPIDVPEIQSLDGKKISEFAAAFAAEKLGKPVVKSDVTYSIAALNGFPGPFVKFINMWLSPDDLLKMMAGKKDRTVTIIEYITYVTPEGKIVSFAADSKGTITENVSRPNVGTTLDKILIRNGCGVPQNIMSKKQLGAFFRKNCEAWHKLGQFLKRSESKAR